MTAWWYWALFALTVVIFIAPWLLFKWEQRQDERDARLWARLHGGDTYSRRVD